MPDFGMAFEQLTSTDTAVTAGVALGGYMAPFIVDNLTSRAGLDLPDELDGLVVFALIAAMPDSIPVNRAGEAGALVYSAEKVAERLGVKSTVAGVGN